MKPTFENLVQAAASSARVAPTPLRRALKHFFRHVSDAVWATGRVSLPGLVSLRVRNVKGRALRNPVTGARMHLPPRRVVRARVSSLWRSR